jgi:hypothetical protein
MANELVCSNLLFFFTLTQEYSIILPLAITIIFGKDGIDLTTDSPGVNNVGVYTVEGNLDAVAFEP